MKACDKLKKHADVDSQKFSVESELRVLKFLYKTKYT